MRNLTIISYNVFGAPFEGQRIRKTFLKTKVRKRLTVIGKTLNVSGADILAFQEVHFYPHLFLLRKLLTNYKFVSYKTHLYGPKGGVVTFSKYPVEKCLYRDFQRTGSYWNKSVVARIGKRGILITKIHDQTYIFNTHLTQNSDHNWSEHNTYTPYLKNQLKELSHLIKQYQMENNLVIVAGDFNMPKDSLYYTSFLKQNKLRDVFTEYDTPTYIEAFAKDTRSAIREDYIFAATPKALHFTKIEELFTHKHHLSDGSYAYLSDHVGLQAQITTPSIDRKDML